MESKTQTEQVEAEVVVASFAGSSVVSAAVLKGRSDSLVNLRPNKAPIVREWMWLGREWSAGCLLTTAEACDFCSLHESAQSFIYYTNKFCSSLFTHSCQEFWNMGIGAEWLPLINLSPDPTTTICTSLNLAILVWFLICMIRSVSDSPPVGPDGDGSVLYNSAGGSVVWQDENKEWKGTSEGRRLRKPRVPALTHVRAHTQNN